MYNFKYCWVNWMRWLWDEIALQVYPSTGRALLNGCFCACLLQIVLFPQEAKHLGADFHIWSTCILEICDGQWKFLICSATFLMIYDCRNLGALYEVDWKFSVRQTVVWKAGINLDYKFCKPKLLQTSDMAMGLSQLCKKPCSNLTPRLQQLPRFQLPIGIKVCAQTKLWYGVVQLPDSRLRKGPLFHLSWQSQMNHDQVKIIN